MKINPSIVSILPLFYLFNVIIYSCDYEANNNKASTENINIKNDLTNSIELKIDSKLEEKATYACLSWLKLIDNDKFNESWTTAGYQLKITTSSEEWSSKMKIISKKQGSVVNRKIFEKKCYKKLSTLPEGKHFVFRFKTKYSLLGNTIETIAVTFDDSKWQVVGYYIKVIDNNSME